MDSPRLELRNVSRTYRIDAPNARSKNEPDSNGPSNSRLSNGQAAQEVRALQDVSLAARPGSITVLLGRSGCGKSTLLNLAGAMDFPDRGEVLIDGRSTSGLSDRGLTMLRRKRIGFVFQSFQLLPTLTALENVELPLLIAGERHATRIARERLAWVGLNDRESSMPHQLSGGQMQRVAVARALAHQPEILIADEPTGNLDTASGDQVLQLLSKAARELGATVLMATHSREAAAIASARVRMRDGRIEAVETALPSED